MHLLVSRDTGILPGDGKGWTKLSSVSVIGVFEPGKELYLDFAYLDSSELELVRFGLYFFLKEGELKVEVQ